MTKEVPYFKNLDALRFFAFLGVFISHTIPLPEAKTVSATAFDFISSAFSLFYLGVPFFFTLSSFLITYKLLKEYKENNRIQLLKFYLKRGLRIWPIYFLLLLICFVCLPLFSKILNVEKSTLPDIIPFLLFYSNFYIIQHGVQFIFALIVLWSIAVEEQFYIFWGLIMKYFKKYISAILIFLLCGSIAFCYYYLYDLHQTTGDLKIHSIYAIPNFCLGATIALICENKKASFNLLKKLSPYFYLSVYFFLIVFYVTQKFNITQIDPVISNVIYSLCYALILFDQAFNGKRIFNAGNFVTLNYPGKISYGLYIYHELIVSIMMKLFKFFKPDETFAIIIFQAAITLCITIFLSHISYKYFERYFLNLKARL